MGTYRLTDIQLKRQHSAEPLNPNGVTEARKTSRSGSSGPSGTNTPTRPEDPSAGASGIPIPGARTGPSEEVKKEEDFQVGSPFKRARSSMADFDQGVKDRLANAGGVTSASRGIDEIVGGSGGSMSAARESPSTTGGGLKFGGALFKKQETSDDADL